MPDDRRTVIVTGAASGAGAATARIFAERGDIAYLCDIQSPDKVVDEIRRAGGEAVGFQTDLAVSGNPAKAVQQAYTETGRLDVLIVNHAIVVGGTLDTTDEATYDRVMNVNLKAGFFMAKAALDPMRERGGGVILFAAAVGGVVGMQNVIMYGMAKAAMLQMIRSMVLDHAREGIRFAAVSPTGIDTPMMEEAGKILNASREQFANMTPLNQIIDPSEIGEAFYYLASPAARSITGSTLVIDNGVFAGNFVPPPLG